MTVTRVLRRSMPAGSLCTICWVVGCGMQAQLPTSMDVAITAQDEVSTPAGGGADILADTSWNAFRAPVPEGQDDAPATSPYGPLGNAFLTRAEPDTLMFSVHFDAAGRADGITNNKFYLPEIFGEIFIVDGEFHAGRIPGLTYAVTSFATSEGDRFGVALPIEVRFLGVRLGTATAFAWGTVTDDRLDGTFGYTIDFRTGVAWLVLGPGGGDQYKFYATLDDDE